MKKIISLLVGLLVAWVTGHSQMGRVGIRTATPLSLFHVADSTVLFTGGASYAASPANTPVVNGVMMMWYPDKAAFRAGNISSALTQKDKIGRASIAMGENVEASDIYAVALGQQSKAVGQYSMATNSSTTAFGEASVATGFHSIARGDYSSSAGFYTISRAWGSFAVGVYNDSIASSSPSFWVLEDPIFMIGNGNNLTRKNAMTVLKNAKTGINTSSPLAMLHVSDGSSLVATASTNVVAFFENNASAFLQLASPVNNETGILSASPATNIRGGIIFTSDSAISFRSGGNTTRFQISKSGELTKNATGSANLVPVCYGSVAAAGTINSGSTNFSVTNPVAGQYDITITGENYLSSNFATTVTVISGTTLRHATTGASGGNLQVRIFDSAGTQVNSSFHFIIFKP